MVTYFQMDRCELVLSDETTNLLFICIKCIYAKIELQYIGVF